MENQKIIHQANQEINNCQKEIFRISSEFEKEQKEKILYKSKNKELDERVSSLSKEINKEKAIELRNQAIIKEREETIERIKEEARKKENSIAENSEKEIHKIKSEYDKICAEKIKVDIANQQLFNAQAAVSFCFENILKGARKIARQNILTQRRNQGTVY